MKLQQKNNPLAKKVAMYAAAGAAVTVGGVNMADAEICDSTTVITANAIGESFNVDVDNDGFLDFAISVTGTLNGIGFGSSSFFNIAGVGSNLVGVNDGAVQTYLGGNFYLSGFGSSFAGTSAASAGLMRIRYPSAVEVTTVLPVSLACNLILAETPTSARPPIRLMSRVMRPSLPFNGKKLLAVDSARFQNRLLCRYLQWEVLASPHVGAKNRVTLNS